VATLTVKTGALNAERPLSQQYPQISYSAKLDEALLKILETDWGKWRPRTIDELSGALKANELEHSMRTLTAVLMELVKKEKIRRWSTDTGYVYILAEKEALRS
jgi:predicted transcriptional regulator